MSCVNSKKNIYSRSFEEIVKNTYSHMEFSGIWTSEGANNFEEVKYIKCSFQNVRFIDIHFSNLIFEECNFEDCTFQQCEILYQSFMKLDKCIVKKVNFINCNLKNFYVIDSILQVVNFTDVIMTGCNLISNSYVGVKFIDGCDLMDSIIKDNYKFMDIKFISEKSFAKLNYGTYIGRFNHKRFNSNLNEEFRVNRKEVMLSVSNSYMDFGNQFLRNNVSGKYGVCFYESKRAFHETLTGRRRFISRVYNIICGYGERPSRAFIVSLILIILFALAYMITGIKTFNNEIISIKTIVGNYSLSSIFRLFIYCSYFSTATFATVGYGDIMVANISGMIVSIIEIILGVFMIGVWTSTLVRKMIR